MRPKLCGGVRPGPPRVGNGSRDWCKRRRPCNCRVLYMRKDPDPPGTEALPPRHMLFLTAVADGDKVTHGTEHPSFASDLRRHRIHRPGRHPQSGCALVRRADLRDHRPERGSTPPCWFVAHRVTQNPVRCTRSCCSPCPKCCMALHGIMLHCKASQHNKTQQITTHHITEPHIAPQHAAQQHTTSHHNERHHAMSHCNTSHHVGTQHIIPRLHVTSYILQIAWDILHIGCRIRRIAFHVLHVSCYMLQIAR